MAVTSNSRRHRQKTTSRPPSPPVGVKWRLEGDSERRAGRISRESGVAPLPTWSLGDRFAHMIRWLLIGSMFFGLGSG